MNDSILKILTYPQPSKKWEIRVIDKVIFIPTEDMKIPNSFHRLMHKVFFGFIWMKK